MLKLVILICSTSLPLPDCTRATALDALSMPERYASPIPCLMDGQTRAADPAIVPASGNVHVKILCLREIRADMAR